jgi:hypothetical protein
MPCGSVQLSRLDLWNPGPTPQFRNLSLTCAYSTETFSCDGPPAARPQTFADLSLTSRGPGPGGQHPGAGCEPGVPGAGGVKSAAGLLFSGQVGERSTAGTREVYGLC